MFSQTFMILILRIFVNNCKKRDQIQDYTCQIASFYFQYFNKKEQMDVVAPRVCEKHKINADRMCTKYECFLQADILICPQCSGRHFQHKDDIIDISLLNEKVRELMSKRVQFESVFENSCQLFINQLKKFKAFKEEIVTSLNIRERILNDLCKKVRKNIPYEKDKQLFKKHFGFVYLTMKGINPNLDIYNKFCTQINETIAFCRKSIRKFELNWAHSEIPQLKKKQHQIGAVLKKCNEEQQKFYSPKFDKFKKETIKFKGLQEKNKLMRINSEEFFNLRGDCIYWYNTSNFLFPKTLPMGKKLTNIAMIGKNAFVTTQDSGILIYDMIHEKLLKEYASSNHKNAYITGLLSLNSQTVLNFITCPNQIVSLKFQEETGALKVNKGVETNSKNIDAKLISDNFVALFDNKVVNIYKSEYLEKEKSYIFDHLMCSTAKMTETSFALAGECETIYLMDTRDDGIIMKMRTNDYCTQISKIYPYSLIAACGKDLKIFDLRMQKEMFSTRTDDIIRNLQILSSETFITCGSVLTAWSSLKSDSNNTSRVHSP